MKKYLIVLIIVFLAIIGLLYFLNNSEEITKESYIVGQIHDISDNRVLIAEHSQGKNYIGRIEDLQGNAIWLNLEDAKIFTETGEKIDFQELSIGLKVEAWVKGLILESYPAQGTGSQVIVLKESCFAGGCSGELCTNDPEAMSTCELLPGMECLGESMSCELVNNECTWVLSLKAVECLLEVEKNYGPEVKNTRIGYLFEKANQYEIF